MAASSRLAFDPLTECSLRSLRERHYQYVLTS